MSLIKQLFLLILIAGLAGAGYYGYQTYVADQSEVNASENSASGKRRKGRGAHRVETVSARRDTVRDSIEAVGTTRAYQAIEVVSLASGRVIQIAARPGQDVKNGDPIILLDDDIEKANLAEAEAKLRKAQSFLQRSQRLRENRNTSLASLEQLQAEATGAQAELERSKRRLADRIIRAPFSGRIGLNKVEIGARVDTNTVLTTLDDVSKIEIEFQLPETVFGRTRTGMKVTAESAAFPGQIFEGTIEQVDTRIDRVSRTFLVRARLPNSDRRLPAGMFMRLSVILDQREALVVSEEAIVAEGGNNFVFIIDKGRAKRAQVKTGKRKAGSVEIVSGVSDGDLVVARGLARLRTGKRVAIVAGPGAKTEKRSGKTGSAGKLSAEGSVSAVKNGGRELVWRLKDGREVAFKISGRRTLITIDGKKAKRDGIKVGMLCRATASGDTGLAEKIECRAKSGA